jgi:hypothetical protein
MVDLLDTSMEFVDGLLDDAPAVLQAVFFIFFVFTLFRAFATAFFLVLVASTDCVYDFWLA